MEVPRRFVERAFSDVRMAVTTMFKSQNHWVRGEHNEEQLVDINERLSIMQIALASMNQILSSFILPIRYVRELEVMIDRTRPMAKGTGILTPKKG